MNNQFDEFTKDLAQSVTRRAALKKFGVGLAGMALACFGLTNKARATTYQGYCEIWADFSNTLVYTGNCMDINGCVRSASSDCPASFTPLNGNGRKTTARLAQACGYRYKKQDPCSFTI